MMRGAATATKRVAQVRLKNEHSQGVPAPRRGFDIRAAALDVTISLAGCSRVYGTANHATGVGWVRVPIRVAAGAPMSHSMLIMACWITTSVLSFPVIAMP